MARKKGGLEILTERDVQLCEAISLWMRTARKHGREGYYDQNWYPSYPDITKSRLFWRIRTGKAPLPEPPPTAFSCPWYEVVEECERPHHCIEAFIDIDDEGVEKGYVSVNQCTYNLVEKVSDLEAIVQFGTIRYRLWKEDQAGKAEGKTQEESWFIQRIMVEGKED